MSIWTANIAKPGGATMTIGVEKARPLPCPPTGAQSVEQWRELYIDARDYAYALQQTIKTKTRLREEIIAEKRYRDCPTTEIW